MGNILWRCFGDNDSESDTPAEHYPGDYPRPSYGGHDGGGDSSRPGLIAVTVVGFEVFARDLAEFEATNEIPGALSNYVYASRATQRLWFIKLLAAWKRMNPAPTSDEAVAVLLIETLQGCSNFQGLLRFYQLPWPTVPAVQRVDVLVPTVKLETRKLEAHAGAGKLAIRKPVSHALASKLETREPVAHALASKLKKKPEALNLPASKKKKKLEAHVLANKPEASKPEAEAHAPVGEQKEKPEAHPQASKKKKKKLEAHVSVNKPETSKPEANEPAGKPETRKPVAHVPAGKQKSKAEAHALVGKQTKKLEAHVPAGKLEMRKQEAHVPASKKKEKPQVHVPAGKLKKRKLETHVPIAELDHAKPKAWLVTPKDATKVQYEIHTLPVVWEEDKGDGDGFTVLVNVYTDARETKLLPRAIHDAALLIPKAQAQKNYKMADALHKRIEAENYKVFVRKSDGVWCLAREYKIRLRGVDAPEIQQPYGKEARDLLRSLVRDQQLVIRVYNTDNYGRKVGDIYCNGIFIQEVLLKKGSVWHYSHFDKRANFAEWERASKKASLGLWANPNQEAPWDYRQRCGNMGSSWGRGA